MQLENYSTTGSLRREFPKIETTLGEMSYWRSITFGEHGWTYLGGFERPYVSGQHDKTFTVNNVEYEGSISVFLRRDSEMSLEFSSVHRVEDWRSSLSDAAMRKIEKEFLPLAKELFPLPTTEHYAHYVQQEADREAYSAISSALHSLSVKVYHDKRYAGYAEALKDGFRAGMERALPNIDRESFSVDTRY
jgi:hypothetical protein